jgi:hypothetical protein
MKLENRAPPPTRHIYSQAKVTVSFSYTKQWLNPRGVKNRGDFLFGISAIKKLDCNTRPYL